MPSYDIWCYPKMGRQRKDKSLPQGYFQGVSPHLGKVTVFKTVIKDERSPNHGQEVLVVSLAKGRRMLKDRKQWKGFKKPIVATEVESEVSVELSKKTVVK